MAGFDYYNCDNCGRGKIFYDADVDWESFGNRIGQIRVLCDECYEKGFRLNVVIAEAPLVDVKVDLVHNWGTHCWTRESKKNK